MSRKLLLVLVPSIWNVGQQVCQFKTGNDEDLHVFLGKLW